MFAMLFAMRLSRWNRSSAGWAIGIAKRSVSSPLPSAPAIEELEWIASNRIGGQNRSTKSRGSDLIGLGVMLDWGCKACNASVYCI